MTVTAAPGPSADHRRCAAGAGTLLSDGTGGTWSSSNTAAATVGSTGSVSGILPGTTTIIYTLGGCTSMHVVTVSAAPGAITGAATVCAGSEITLSDGGGGTWTSSNTAVATVDGSGDVWGANGGTATIAYSLGGGLRGHKGDNSERRIGNNRRHRAVHRHGNTAGGHPCGHVAERQYVCSHGERHRRCWRGGLRTATITHTTPAGCTATTTVTVNTVPSLITERCMYAPGYARCCWTVPAAVHGAAAAHRQPRQTRPLGWCAAARRARRPLPIR